MEKSKVDTSFLGFLKKVFYYNLFKLNKPDLSMAIMLYTMNVLNLFLGANVFNILFFSSYTVLFLLLMDSRLNVKVAHEAIDTRNKLLKESFDLNDMLIQEMKQLNDSINNKKPSQN